MINKEQLRETLAQIGINYDDYEDDGWALLDAIAAKWDNIGQIDDALEQNPK